MNNFCQFRNDVYDNLNFMVKNNSQLYVVDLDKDHLWWLYLDSFPEDTNPIFKERTEHDCQCCKQFIRSMGNVVSITESDGIQSIWDVDTVEPYRTVAEKLAEYVRSHKIKNIFLSDTRTKGTRFNVSIINGEKITWDHFYWTVAPAFVVGSDTLDAKLGRMRSRFDVFHRALCEISLDAIATVMDLVNQNSLYRGEEFAPMVSLFEGFKILFNEAADTELFAWKYVPKVSSAVAHIRNSSIGSLLIDLSNGVDINTAVASYERKVAPTNYKRPTALVTTSMVKKAEEKIKELGLMESLERRYATLEDITINNVLFADRKSRLSMSVFEELMDEAMANMSVSNFKDVTEIPIGSFIEDVLPSLSKVEVIMENSHISNLVSLVAPVNKDAPHLFKWNNGFSWSYNGNTADSIKDKVKLAGGNVDGVLRCSLSWHNSDDLDLHAVEPTGRRIYFSNKRSPSSGSLDVDMNAGQIVNDPVENIIWTNRRSMPEGKYSISVHNYNRRFMGNHGFTVEIEVGGATYTYEYAEVVKDGETINIADVFYENGKFRVVGRLKETPISKEAWNIRTHRLQNVSVIMNSPNHWDGNNTGNKHWFFMIEGCVADMPARGFYNEYLKPELDEHRKVFEVLGSKLMVPQTSNQLSGLGFSSTAKNALLCRLTGSFTRMAWIIF